MKIAKFDYLVESGEQILNGIALSIICFSLGAALCCEFMLHEIPCRLCVLQRIGLTLVGIGIALNLRFGCKSSHYGLVLLGSIGTGMVALRQIFLHVCPGSTGYGSEILGLHLYTWTAIAAALSIVFVAAMIICRESPGKSDITGGVFCFIGILLLFSITFVNVIAIAWRYGLI
ncbi:TPA: disulfide bond formation protein B [Burkholderia cepacia]